MLLSVKDDKPSPTPLSIVTETKIPDVQSEEKYVASDSAKVTTDDEWVRPSQISRDRVRTGSLSGSKSEMEKAMEVFAKAETVGIEEADGSGIVEPRMLRASEVRELMSEEAVIPQETAPPVQPEVIPTPSPAPVTPIVPPVATPPPLSPEPTPAAPPVTPPPVPDTAPEVVPEVSPKVAPASSTNKFELPVVKPTPSEETPPPPAPKTQVKPQEPVATSAASISLDTRVPEIEDVLAKVSEPEDLQDSKIKDYVANLTHQHAELRQVKADLTSISARLDEFVRSCLNDSQVKRIHYESVNEQMRFAKKEFETAKKEYERVEKKRKKEISSLEGRIKNVQKNISKSENALKKRISELDKVREKIAQLQAQDS